MTDQETECVCKRNTHTLSLSQHPMPRICRSLSKSESFHRARIVLSCVVTLPRGESKAKKEEKKQGTLFSRQSFRNSCETLVFRCDLHILF